MHLLLDTKHIPLPLLLMHSKVWFNVYYTTRILHYTHRAGYTVTMEDWNDIPGLALKIVN